MSSREEYPKRASESKATANPRSGRSGRRPGASGTRDAILTAARHQFAEHGYDRASLRAIAAEAEVDQKLVAYFFGAKQRLFIAAVGLPLNPAEMLPAILDGDPATAEERLRGLLTQLLAQPAFHERLTGVLRAAASEPSVARMLREFIDRELVAPVAQRLPGDDADLRLTLMGSQLIGLLIARHVLGLEPLASLPAERVAAAVTPALLGYLTGPAC